MGRGEIPAHPEMKSGFPFRYGMRYMAKVLKATLTEKFPDASKEEIYKVGWARAQKQDWLLALTLGVCSFPSI